MDDTKAQSEKARDLTDPDVVVVEVDGALVNSSGHRDQLRRGYGFTAICGLALTVDNAWVAIGTSLNVAIYNGGPPGILYEFLTACFYYSFIAASIAELASSVPSSGGVYHWATLTAGPRYGRVNGFYAGFINFFGWLFDLASIVYIMAELLVQMYGIYHPEYLVQQWHIFVALVIVTWLCISVTIFLNRFLPALQKFGFFVVVVGGIVSIVVVASMPKQRASNSFVWSDFDNQTGWSGGVAFLAGVLNGAFAIGTPDAVTHMAEELPNPKKDLPKAVFAQISLGFIFAFSFAIALSYGITDLDAVLKSNGSFPLAEIYSQATGSRAATFGLLFIVFLSLTPCLVGTFLTVGRTYWTLARDNATPFSGFFSRVNEKLSCPIPATLLTGVLTIAFGAIPLGSHVAFSDLVGSFVILSSTSYALCFLPHVLSGRKNIPKGYFWMGSVGFAVNSLAVLFTVIFNIFYCFPYTLPTSVGSMNYNSVILVGVVVLTTIWWFIHGSAYEGAKVGVVYLEGEAVRRLSKIT